MKKLSPDFMNMLKSYLTKINRFLSYKVVPFLTGDKKAPNVFLWHANFLNWKYLKKGIKQVRNYTRGICLDIGCGKHPYRKYLASEIYIGVDRELNSQIFNKKFLFIKADARYLPLKLKLCDTVLLTQVLEHIYEYNDVLSEISNILKKKGVLIISVPFIYNIHSEPNDYFRFSEYALRRLLEQNNFCIEEFYYLGYAGTALISIWNNFLWQIWNRYELLKFLRNTIFLFPILICFVIFNMLGLFFDIFKNEKFTPNYLVVAKKK